MSLRFALGWALLAALSPAVAPAQRSPFSFTAWVGPAGSRSQPGSDVAVVYLRWDVGEETLPADVTHYELRRGDQSIATLPVGGVASVAQLLAIYGEPENDRRLRELRHRLLWLEPKLPAAPEDVLVTARERLLTDPVFAWLGERLDINLARARHHAWIDSVAPASAGTARTYTLLGLRGAAAPLRLGVATVTPTLTNVLPAVQELKALSRSDLASCTERGAADGVLGLSFRPPGMSPTDRVLWGESLAGVAVFVDPTPLADGVSVAPPRDVRALAAQQGHQADGTVAIPGLVELTPLPLVPPPQEGTDNAAPARWIASPGWLAEVGLAPGRRYAVYAVTLDVFGGYGATAGTVASVHDAALPLAPELNASLTSPASDGSPVVAIEVPEVTLASTVRALGPRTYCDLDQAGAASRITYAPDGTCAPGALRLPVATAVESVLIYLHAVEHTNGTVTDLSPDAHLGDSDGDGYWDSAEASSGAAFTCNPAAAPPALATALMLTLGPDALKPTSQGARAWTGTWPAPKTARRVWLRAAARGKNGVIGPLSPPASVSVGRLEPGLAPSGVSLGQCRLQVLTGSAALAMASTGGCGTVIRDGGCSDADGAWVAGDLTGLARSLELRREVGTESSLSEVEAASTLGLRGHRCGTCSTSATPRPSLTSPLDGGQRVKALYGTTCSGQAPLGPAAVTFRGPDGRALATAPLAPDPLAACGVSPVALDWDCTQTEPLLAGQSAMGPIRLLSGALSPGECLVVRRSTGSHAVLVAELCDAAALGAPLNVGPRDGRVVLLVSRRSASGVEGAATPLPAFQGASGSVETPPPTILSATWQADPPGFLLALAHPSTPDARILIGLSEANGLVAEAQSEPASLDFGAGWVPMVASSGLYAGDAPAMTLSAIAESQSEGSGGSAARRIYRVPWPGATSADHVRIAVRSVSPSEPGGASRHSPWSPPVVLARPGAKRAPIPWPATPGPATGAPMLAEYLTAERVPIVRIGTLPFPVTTNPASSGLCGNATGCALSRTAVFTGTGALDKAAVLRGLAESVLPIIVYRQSRASTEAAPTDFVQVTPMLTTWHHVVTATALTLDDPHVGVIATSLGAATSDLVFVDRFPHVAGRHYRYEVLGFDGGGEVRWRRVTGWVEVLP